MVVDVIVLSASSNFGQGWGAQSSTRTEKHMRKELSRCKEHEDTLVSHRTFSTFFLHSRRGLQLLHSRDTRL